MTPAQIRRMVGEYALRSSYGSEPHFKEISSLGAVVVPYFLEAFPKARRWQQRASFLYAANRHCRTSRDAVTLAIKALNDRSREVRYRACLLLACSLDETALDSLASLQDHSDLRTREDVAAAIDAITSQNHNYFVDRTHSGKITYNFSNGPKLTVPPNKSLERTREG
jgi:hypothetical protein